MLSRLVSFIRKRWHPLWRLRQFASYRRFQKRFDFTVHTKIPDTGIKVAVRLMRDASWVFNPADLEPEIRMAFRLVLDLVRPAVFWDIGANIGFYSWFVRRHPAVRQVLMFEPDPVNYSLIRNTIDKNAIHNCRATNVALADTAGEASFLVDRASGATGSLLSDPAGENGQGLHHAYRMSETIICRTSTIDQLISGGESVPDFLKIDVEGAEHLVIAGANACLHARRPAMIIETANMDLVCQLRDSGYVVFRIDDGNLLFVHAAHQLDLTSLDHAFSRCEASL